MWGSDRKNTSLTLSIATHMWIFNLNIVLEYATQACMSVAVPKRQRGPQARAHARLEMQGGWVAFGLAWDSRKGRVRNSSVHYSNWAHSVCGAGIHL